MISRNEVISEMYVEIISGHQSGEVLTSLILKKSFLRLTPALVADQYNERYQKPFHLCWRELVFASELCGSANATNLPKPKDKQMILGIDIAKDKFDIALCQDNQVIASGQFDNRSAGFKKLSKWFRHVKNPGTRVPTQKKRPVTSCNRRSLQIRNERPVRSRP